MSLDFIMIDNNQLNCFIIERMLHNIDKSLPLKTFVHAHEAYEAIKNSAPKATDSQTVILLDIHMPLMDGFEFLEEFDNLPTEVRDHYTIYILTSSTDKKDKARSAKSSSVKRFISKPLTFDILTGIIAEMK